MPTVNWQKENVNVVASDNVVMEVQGHRHILRIAKVGDNDFGEYVCSAKNYLGKSEKKIALVKTPVVLGFEIEKEGKETILTWEVESIDPITAHDLQYKKVEVSRKIFINLWCEWLLHGLTILQKFCFCMVRPYTNDFLLHGPAAYTELV